MSRRAPILPVDASDRDPGKPASIPNACLHRRDLDQDQYDSAARLGGPKGQRLRGLAPHGHWRTLTFLGALRCDRLTAPCVFDGPINGQCFRAYVEQQLITVLKPGDIVVMDNQGSHKSAAIRQMIKAAGARLWYLPPYSPDLYPIEQDFAKIKHWMRQAQKRTVEDTWRHIGHLVETIEAAEIQELLRKRRIRSHQKVKNSSETIPRSNVAPHFEFGGHDEASCSKTRSQCHCRANQRLNIRFARLFGIASRLRCIRNRR